MAAKSFSLYIVIQKRMLARYRPVEITTYAIWAGTLLLLPFSFGLVGAVQSAPLALSGVVVVNTLGRARRTVSSPAPLPPTPSP